MRHRRSSDLPAGFVPARLAPTPGLEGLARIVRGDFTRKVEPSNAAHWEPAPSVDPKRGKRGKRQK